MTTRTRKAPTGPKHDRCIDHVEHAYPKSGMLCIGREVGRESMIAFVDDMAAKAAAHRAADDAAVTAMHLAARPGGRKSQPTIKNAPAGASHISRTPADAAALADLVARFRARRGLPVETAAQPEPDTYAAAIARKPARKPSPAVRASRRREIAAVMASVQPETVQAPEPVVEPAAVEPVSFYGVPVSAGHLGYSWTIESGIVEVFQIGSSVCRAAISSPIMSEGSRSGREWWPVGESFAAMWRPLTFASIADAQSARELAERQPETVEPEPTAEPGQVNDGGEPDGAGTAAAHEFGDYCECGECVKPGTPDPVEPEPAAQPEPWNACAYTVGSGPNASHCIAGAAGHDGPHDWPSVREVRRGPADAAVDMVAGDGFILPRADLVTTGIARVVEPAAVEASRCWHYLHTLGGMRRCTVEPDLHNGAHEYDAVLRPMGPIAPEPTPEPVETAQAIDAQNRADMAAYIAEQAPAILAAVPAAGRPTCERCGQSFRKSGSGLAWHIANRPDCSAGRLSVVA